MFGLSELLEAGGRMKMVVRRYIHDGNYIAPLKSIQAVYPYLDYILYSDSSVILVHYHRNSDLLLAGKFKKKIVLLI